MRVHVVQHVSFEGPAGIAAWARERGHDLTITLASDTSCPGPDAYDLLVVMGGPMGVRDVDLHPWLAAEKDAIRSAIDAGKLVLGVCLGAQLVAHAMGAGVRRNPEPEIGWFPVTLTSGGVASRVFGMLPAAFTAGHWHGDTFDIPVEATRTASSEACVNQAFEAHEGRVIGLQFHLEWDREALTTLVEHAAGDLSDSPWVQTADELIGEKAPFSASRQLLWALLDGMAG